MVLNTQQFVEKLQYNKIIHFLYCQVKSLKQIAIYLLYKQ